MHPFMCVCTAHILCAGINNDVHGLCIYVTVCKLCLQATLVTFTRGENGMLGFTINEAGVVLKVDGMAKNTGLTVNSRLLQV